MKMRHSMAKEWQTTAVEKCASDVRYQKILRSACLSVEQYSLLRNWQFEATISQKRKGVHPCE
jgi:hypothetical protein